MEAGLSIDRYLDALTAQSARLADALRASDLSTRVPTCPDWTLRDLTAHLGQAHRWVAATILARSTTQLDPKNITADPVPNDAREIGRWLRAGAANLVDAVRVVGPETRVWTWSDDQRVAFWARRMAHETAVHRADVEITLNRPFVLEPDLAADAITEWLEILSLPRVREIRPEVVDALPVGRTLHLHSTDAGLGEAGEWIVRRGPANPVWERGHAKGDVALRGSVVNLLLLMMRRVPPERAGVDILGNRAVLDHWLDYTRF